MIALSFSAIQTYGQSATLSENISDEGSIRDASDYSIVINLVDDTLVSEIGTQDVPTANFLGGMSGGSAAWDDLVNAISTSDVVLSNNNTTVTITISQKNEYYIVSDDSIGFEIPGNSLLSGNPLLVSDSIVVENLLPTLSFGGDLAPGVDESAIRNGDQTFSLTLNGNLWRSDITSASDALTDIKGMFSNAPVFATMVSALTSGSLSLSGDSKTLTITFSRKTDYYISADESVNVDVPQSLLEYSEAFSGSTTTSFTISNENPQISITTENYPETAIRSGDIYFDISLSGDVWATTLSSDFGDRIVSGGTFDTEITPNLEITRTGNSTVQVKIPQTPGFDISSDEAVTITVIAADLQHSVGGPYNVSGTKNILAALPGITAGGTIASGINEGDIRTTAYTITVEVSEDTWVSDIATNGTNTRDLIESIEVWDERKLGGAMGIIAHTAYHLGEIRQMLCHLD